MMDGQQNIKIFTTFCIFHIYFDYGYLSCQNMELILILIFNNKVLFGQNILLHFSVIVNSIWINHTKVINNFEVNKIGTTLLSVFLFQIFLNLSRFSVDPKKIDTQR
jgi:hypothetical protein